MNVLKYLPLVVLLTSCSSESMTQPVDDQPRTANEVMVAYPDLVQTGYAPTLHEVMTTGRDSHWLCTFGFTGTQEYWQTVAYFYSNYTGESVYNESSTDLGFPNYFPFKWSGEQAVSIVSDHVQNFTVFDFKFETDPVNIIGPRVIYQFIAQHSLGGYVVCAKMDGER